MAHHVPGIAYSVSYTTRSPRPGEVHGKDYFFVSREEFETLIRKNAFAEWAEVHGNLYGTHEGFLLKTMDQGIDVLLDVDAQGATSLKKRFSEGVFIYILPPSMESLRERLYERRSDSPEEIERRLAQARREIANFHFYSYLVVNDDFKKASRELESIILSERVRRRPMDADWIKDDFLKG
jgi:guanylate kinase